MATSREISDAFACLSHIGMTGRCPGGRLIVKGYICLHCGRDDSEPGFRCPQPARTDERRI